MAATTLGPVTVQLATHLAAIVSAAQRGARVAWLHDDRVGYGTARSIGDEGGGFARADEDIRNCHLRVTTDLGFELFVPMSDVLARYADGTFVLDPVRA
jgi:hypothetical protein